MKHFLQIFVLVSLIAGVLILDNYYKGETAYMKELLEVEKVHQRVQASRLERTFDKIFFDKDHLDSLQPKLAIISSYVDSAIKTTNYSYLKDTLARSFKSDHPIPIWNATPEIVETQSLEFFNQWMEAQIDSSRFAKWRDPINFEMVIGYIEKNDDSIQFACHYILPLDSPYIDPWDGEPIVVDSLKLY